LFFLIDQEGSEGFSCEREGANQSVTLYSSGDSQALKRLSYWLKSLLGDHEFDCLDLSMSTARIDTPSS